MIIYKPQGNRKEVVSTGNMQKQGKVWKERGQEEGEGKRSILPSLYPIVSPLTGEKDHIHMGQSGTVCRQMTTRRSGHCRS